MELLVEAKKVLFYWLCSHGDLVRDLDAAKKDYLKWLHERLLTCLRHFFFAGHLVSFIMVGKFFGKAFRVLGLDERKGRWIVTQDFHGNFSGYGHGFTGEWVD